MIDGRARLHGGIAEAWRPRPAISRADWCSANIVLPPEVSASPGPYDLKRYPYWRGVIDASEDSETERIVISAAAQVGKTTVLIALLAAAAATAPAPAMFGAPDRDALVDLRDRFYAICEASRLADVPPMRLRNKRWIDVGLQRCHLAFPMNTQSLSGKSAKLVIATEVDRWRRRKTHGDPLQMIFSRVKAFYRGLIVLESTPSDESSRIHQAYAESDRRRFLVPCPHCNWFQELRFFAHRKGEFAGKGGTAGFRADDGRWHTADEARDLAHYICEQGCKIWNEEKTSMVADGQWLPMGQAIDRKGRVTGKPARSPRVAGFRLGSIYAETQSFSRLAINYLEARKAGQAAMQIFFNDDLGLRYTRRGKTPQWRTLWQRLRGDQAPGTVPAWALFLTAAADPGPSYVRWTVRAWGEGSTSALVDWGTTHATAGSRTAQYDALRASVLDREFPLAAANAAGEAALKVRLLAIDVGFKPRAIHQWVRSLPESASRRVRQVVGKTELPQGQPYRRSVVEVNARTGQKYEGGQERWEISRAIYNQDLRERWKLGEDEPGTWWLTSAPIGQCELFLRELTNEAPARRVNKLGRTVTVWEKIHKSTGNHYGDCAAYELAAADMVTGGDWRNLIGRKRQAKPRRGKPAPDAQGQAPAYHGRMRDA